MLKMTKRRTIKAVIILAIIIVHFFNPLHAQSEHKSNFIGVNPSITVEPFYEKGELDVNILPIVYQTPMSNRRDLFLL